MNGTLDRPRRAPSVTANGFVSAVLLVVLFATSGWPGEAERLAEGVRVESCEVRHATARGRAAAARQLLLLTPCSCAVVQRAACPRVLPRTRRVDTGGLPPPRAPTERA